MSDGIPDALKAIAETAGKAIDVVAPGAEPVSRETGGIIANALGYLIGDKLAHKRLRNLGELERETRDILSARGVSDPREVSIAVGQPLLSAAQDESRAELRALWARLLANAMDPARPDNVRLEFIEALRQFHPVDALILKELRTMKGQATHSRQFICGKTGIHENAFAVSIMTLKRLNCADGLPSNPEVTPFGIELLLACAE